MGLKRTKLLGIQAVAGINTVGILTVGVTETAGGVGIASTTYFRGMVMHNTGLNTCTSSLYVYPEDVAADGIAHTAYRLTRIDLASNETFFYELNYPIVLVNREKVVVEVTAPSSGGTGIGSAVNFQILGDTDI
tara:strand:+ start:27 stop:428 length:402 start_codon:yes stop_codon:yes gene_type:complete